LKKAQNIFRGSGDMEIEHRGTRAVGVVGAEPEDARVDSIDLGNDIAAGVDDRGAAGTGRVVASDVDEVEWKGTIRVLVSIKAANQAGGEHEEVGAGVAETINGVANAGDNLKRERREVATLDAKDANIGRGVPSENFDDRVGAGLGIDDDGVSVMNFQVGGEFVRAGGKNATGGDGKGGPEGKFDFAVLTMANAEDEGRSEEFVAKVWGADGGGKKMGQRERPGQDRRSREAGKGDKLSGVEEMSNGDFDGLAELGGVEEGGDRSGDGAGGFENESEPAKSNEKKRAKAMAAKAGKLKNHGRGG
jgi:hypothetical protein